MKKLMLLVFAITLFFSPKLVAAQNSDPEPAKLFEFSVEHEHTFGDCRGTLAITPDKIEYRTNHKEHSRSWQYIDIQQIKVKSPTKIEVTTYEDRKLRLGRDRTFEFKLIEGQISPEVIALLMAKTTRPVVTSVMPVVEGSSKFEIPVKHLHTFGGCEGRLRIYSDRVTYESEDKPTHSRYWHYSDIELFGHPTRYRFEITTHEEKFGGPTKVYDFELKEDFPSLAYDYIWVRVNPSELYPRAGTREALAADRPAQQDIQVQSESRNPSPERPVTPVAEATRDGVAPRTQQGETEVQTVRVILGDDGYQPSSVNLKQGVPARIEFVRQTETTCGTEIVIPEYKIKRGLPLNEPVVVELTPNKSGEFVFTCGMNMLRGKIVVQEEKDSPAVASEPQPQQEPPAQRKKPEVQTARITLTEQGYNPSGIKLKEGIPARVTFVRQAEATCGTEIVIPEYGIKRALPLNEPVVVEFTPGKSGEFVFTCGMNMLRGKIVVQEMKDSQAAEKETETKQKTETREPKRAPEVQTSRVILTEQGYKPASIRLKRGVPARVTFVRQTEATCGTEIVIPEYGIKRALPLNKPVVVRFTPKKSGEFSFTCGMRMLRGKVVVQ